MEIDVSIIIVNWNGKDILYNCIESIKKYCTEGYEIIIIDNNSTDGSIEFVEKSFQGLKIIKSIENEGFAKANNKGFLEATGEYILLLNSDTVFLDDNIKIVSSFMKKNKDIDMVGVNLLNSDFTLQKNCYKLPNLTTYFFEYIIRFRFSQNYNYRVEHEVECISGAYMFIRKDRIEKIGLFDEKYYFYQEDTDLCKRFFDNKCKMYYIPYSKVIHIGGSSTKSVKAKMLYQMHRNRYLYMKKHCSLIKQDIFNLITKVGLISDLIVSTIKLLFFKVTFMEYIERIKIYKKIFKLNRRKL